jgi:hypothetical protein
MSLRPTKKTPRSLGGTNGRAPEWFTNSREASTDPDHVGYGADPEFRGRG